MFSLVMYFCIGAGITNLFSATKCSTTWRITFLQWRSGKNPLLWNWRGIEFIECLLINENMYYAPLIFIQKQLLISILIFHVEPWSLERFDRKILDNWINMTANTINIIPLHPNIKSFPLRAKTFALDGNKYLLLMERYTQG